MLNLYYAELEISSNPESLEDYEEFIYLYHCTIPQNQEFDDKTKSLIIPVYFKCEKDLTLKIIRELFPSIKIRYLEISTPTTDTTQMSTPSDRRTLLKRLGLEQKLKTQ